MLNQLYPLMKNGIAVLRKVCYTVRPRKKETHKSS